MKPTVYRGYQITPIFQFTNGKMDAIVHRISEGEDGPSQGAFLARTLESIKGEIDSNLPATNVYVFQNIFTKERIAVESLEVPFKNDCRLFSILKMDIKDFKFSQIK